MLLPNGKYSYACQNSWLLNGLLKDEMGFSGYVQSDWLAQRSGVASALAGLDMSMPGDGLYWKDGNSLFGQKLTLAVLNGSVPVERINDMATRIVAAWYQVGQDTWENDGPNFSSWTNEAVGKVHFAATDSNETATVNRFVETSDADSRKVARRVAHEGTVLLKNEAAARFSNQRGLVMMLAPPANAARHSPLKIALHAR